MEQHLRAAEALGCQYSGDVTTLIFIAADGADDIFVPLDTHDHHIGVQMLAM